MTVGIVGAGQLGRMLALAGYPLGLDFLCLDPARDAPAGQVAPLLHGAFTDRGLLTRLVRACEVVTFDWENVPVAELAAAARRHRGRIRPPLAALATGQDRVAEKRLFERLGIPTTRWRAVSSRAELTRALADAVALQQPPRAGMVRPKLRYAHQGGMNPPVIVIHGSALGAIPQTYRRFLEHFFVDVFQLQGTPLRIQFKTGANPYAGSAVRRKPRRSK